MEGLTEGRIVHFVMPDGEHRPAIIVKVWSKETGVSNLTVFSDWGNDNKPSGPFWATSILPSDTHEPNTWHWIEKA